MNYNQLINSEPVVLIEFFASWCPHCQRMMPIVADVKKRVSGSFALQQFDIDENSDLAQDNGVDSLPTFIIYQDGQEVWRHEGEMQELDLLHAIQKFSK
jgi:thioredoxin 1